MSRLLQLSSRSADVDLRNLLSTDAAGVLHRYADGDVFTTHLHAGLRVFERGVAHAIAEGIRNVLAERVEVAIAHVDVFLVVAHLVTAGEVARRSVVVDADGPCHRELSRRTNLTREHIGDGISCFLARLPSTNDGVCPVAPRRCLDDRSAVDDHHHGFSCSMEDFADVLDELLLIAVQEELPLCITVATLSGLTSKGDNSHISLFHLMVNHIPTHGHLRKLLVTPRILHEPLASVVVGLELRTRVRYIFIIYVCQHLRRTDACILQAFYHIGDVRCVNASRTSTTRQHVVAAHTKQCYGHVAAILLNGQGESSIILHQHDAFRGSLTSEDCMTGEVGLVGKGIVAEARRLHDVLQHATHVSIHVGHAQFTFLHGSDNLLGLLLLSRLQQVVACGYLISCA